MVIRLFRAPPGGGAHIVNMDGRALALITNAMIRDERRLDAAIESSVASHDSPEVTGAIRALRAEVHAAIDALQGRAA